MIIILNKNQYRGVESHNVLNRYMSYSYVDQANFIAREQQDGTYEILKDRYGNPGLNVTFSQLAELIASHLNPQPAFQPMDLYDAQTID